MRPSPTLTVSFSEFVCVSLERFARESPFRQRLHQFGVIEQLHQLGDRFVGRRMLSGEVTRDDRLRLEDRIDENVVAHDPSVPHGVNGRATHASIIRHLLNGGLTRSVVGARRRVTALKAR